LNNTFLVTLLALMLVMLLTVLAVTLLDGRGANSAMLPQPSEPVTQSSAAQSSAPGYVLGCYDGRLALFPEGDAVPERVYEVWVERLPEADRQKLLLGIPVENEAELARLLEDLTS